MRKPNPGETLWSEALVARLSELWLSGTTSGEIGRRLGITRSSVMGKLRRLDMLCRDRRPPPIRPPQMPVIRRNKRPPKTPDRYFAEFAAKPLPPPPIGSFDLLELRQGHCRWPTNDASPWTFCGMPQVRSRVTRSIPNVRSRRDAAACMSRCQGELQHDVARTHSARGEPRPDVHGARRAAWLGARQASRRRCSGSDSMSDPDAVQPL